MAGIDTGGEAYPRNEGHYEDEAWVENPPGMTLLDHFAGQALVGELACQDEEDVGMYSSNEGCGVLLAGRCYTFAAAMVAEKRRREAT